jgi:uncharacterized protein YjiS (DUF1127 family)
MVTIDTITSNSHNDPVRPARLARLMAIARAVVAALTLRRRQRRTRIHLAQLTEEQLRDVGLSPDMAEREIRKSRLLLVERLYQPPV